MAKIFEMKKSKTQLWGEVFQGRKPETAKYNQAESDAMFATFTNQLDKLAAAKDMNRVTEVPDKEEK